jgi:hypothetical protein
MEPDRAEMLLRRFRLCRADIVETIGSSALPPSPQSLRSLAELQLAIMAIEASIADKADIAFLSDYRGMAA